jgi:spore coat polysaccharide biosynthesis protein SpsF
MIGAIVQARMGSTRLPGKVMMEAAGKPLLAHLLERLSYCRHLEKTIVATSTNERDDPIEHLCNSLRVLVYRGSEYDVLDRYYQAAEAFGITCIVRVTSDCPLIDPELIDETICCFMTKLDDYDLITNRHPLTYIDGLDFDLIPSASLDVAWRTARTPHQREHVVPFFWESGMRVHNFEDPRRLFYSNRWTLDYIEDYELIKSIYSALYKNGQRLTTKHILTYLSAHRDLSEINSKYLPPAISQSNSQ